MNKKPVILILGNLFIVFLLLSICGSAATETRYLRSDTHIVNGLNAYQLETSNSASSSYFEDTYGGISTTCPSGVGIFRSDVFVLHADGSETLLGSDVASTSRSGSASSEGYQSATWDIPETSLSATDAIKVVEEAIASGASTTRTFITEQLNAFKLNAATWTFTRYTWYSYSCNYNPSLGQYQWSWTARTYHGSPTYDTLIQGFSYESYIDYVDCGLRIKDNAGIIVIACEPLGTLTSPLRIAKNGDIYGIALVDVTDPNASKIRINTSSGIKALRKFIPPPSPPENIITTVDPYLTSGWQNWFTSIAIGSDGLPVITYFNDGANSLKVAHCTSANCSTYDWPRTVVYGSGFWPSMAIGSDGFPVISYSNYVDDPENLLVLHCTNVRCSTYDTPITLDSGYGIGRHTSIAIGSDGFPVISYLDDSGGNEFKVVHCTNVECSSYDAPIMLDSGGEVGKYNSIAIGSDGFPVISYHLWGTGYDGDLKVVHCTNVECSSYDAPITLDLIGNVGRYTSIAIGSDGFPVISYFDYGNKDLKVVHCTNVRCSSYDPPITLDSSGSVGWDTSITIGTDGFPIISYQGWGNGELKVVHCTNVRCSSYDPPIIVDSSPDTGWGTSITIDNYGLPLISYIDNYNADLKVLHCGAIDCDP